MKFYIGSGFQSSGLVNRYAGLLTREGWQHTFNWANIDRAGIEVEEMVRYAVLEQEGIAEADVVIILLPAGRGTHIELGMALAQHKRVFLCAEQEAEFSLENTVNFYELPAIVKLVGTAEENVEKILQA